MSPGVLDAVLAGGIALADGGIETRVLFETDFPLGGEFDVSRMVGDPRGEPILRRIYSDYVEIAAEFELPILVGTPTFRASEACLRRMGNTTPTAVRDVNAACTRFSQGIRAGFPGARVAIAGVIGPAGDAYRPEEGLDAVAAARYHRPQAEALAEAGVDCLYAPTFPAGPEAEGAAQAMAATGLPYINGFVFRGDGCLLDGTLLTDLVRRIDDAVNPPPLWYSLCCVFPTVAADALAAQPAGAAALTGRIWECKANGSRLSPAALAGLGHLVSTPPEEWAAAEWALRERFGLRILGGCCGTGPPHLRALARRISSAA